MIDTPMVALRFALYADLALVFGVPLFALYALSVAERRRLIVSLWPWASGTALLGVVLSALGVVMLAASMAGVPLLDVDRASVDAILWQTSIGTAAIARMFALMVAAVLALLVPRFPGLGLIGVALCGAVALGSLAWTGHGAMNEGVIGSAHLASDILHLLAAGAWIGAIFGLALLLFRHRRGFDEAQLLLIHGALDGFAVTGTLLVMLVLLTGFANSWILIGPATFFALPASLYGRLLIAKLVLFAAMLGLAAINRFRLTPRLAGAASKSHATTVRALRLSLLLEGGAALAILGLVAWLGMLEPPNLAS